MRQKVLILGGRGFIGHHLEQLIGEEFDLIPFKREVNSLEEIFKKDTPEIIINCSASKANDTVMDSLKANIEFQLECLRLVFKYNKNPIKWVQVASYFELQIPMGRKDSYSIDKSFFRSVLQRLAEKDLIKVSTIFLPHVFGEGENQNRIIPSIKNNLLGGGIAEISLGEQFLPILGVKDCCFAIKAAVKTDQLICSATPIWYDRVVTLALIMEKAISKGTIRINPEKMSIDNSFPKVEFPPQVKNWQPKMDFSNFINQLSL